MTDGRLAVTVDVEDWYHVPAVSGSPFSPYENAPSFLDSWDGRYDYLTEATRWTLDPRRQCYGSLSIRNPGAVTETFLQSMRFITDPKKRKTIFDRGWS